MPKHAVLFLSPFLYAGRDTRGTGAAIFAGVLAGGSPVLNQK